MALAMQLAINASQAPRRTSSLACCDCLKQKSSISLGAVKAAVALIKDRQVVATNAHFGFVTIGPSNSDLQSKPHVTFSLVEKGHATRTLLRVA